MHPTDDDGGSSAPVTCEDHCDGSPGDVAARTPGHSDDPDNRPGRPKYANQVYFNAIRFYEAALRSNPTYGLSAAKLAYDAAQRWADEQCKEGVQYACLPLDQQPEGPVAMQMAGPCTHDCDKGWASLVELGLALVGAGMGEAEEPMADDPIPGEHLLKGQEPATAHRLMQESDYTGGQLRAYENPNNPNDHAYDYVDEYGRTYDAIGQEKGFTSRKFDMQKFLQTLDEHVFYKQGLNFTVLDLTGASSRQLDAIFDHIDAYSPAAQRRLKITGS